MSILDIPEVHWIPAQMSHICSVVDHHRTDNKEIWIIMTHLTDEEEEALDNFKGNKFQLIRGNRTFNLTSTDIYCYGDIDFNSEKDCDEIRHFNFLNYLGSSGVHIRSNYDYLNHAYKSPYKYALWTETWNPLDLCKIAHGSLRKPKKIIIFKQVYGIIQKKRKRKTNILVN